MGQRERLLQGAKQCIAQKGFSRTTARDIVAVSGANLAAIGYHFGSKEALLTTAVLESFEEWGEAIEAAMTDTGAAAAGAPADRLERFLQGLLDGAAQRRPALVASVQMFAEAEFVPQLREQLQVTYERGAVALGAMLLETDPEAVDEAGRQLGRLALAVMNGVLLQWLVDPERLPSAGRLTAALRRLLEAAPAGR